MLDGVRVVFLISTNQLPRAQQSHKRRNEIVRTDTIKRSAPHRHPVCTAVASRNCANGQ